MDRPLSDIRPLGPVAQFGQRSDVSYFDKIEIQTNSADEDTIYSVAGILPDGSPGVVVDTNALVMDGSDGATIALFEREPGGAGLSMDEYAGDAGLEITAPGKGRVGIGQADKDLTNIIVEEV